MKEGDDRNGEFNGDRGVWPRGEVGALTQMWRLRRDQSVTDLLNC
jgi:hypothetical protein